MRNNRQRPPRRKRRAGPLGQRAGYRGRGHQNPDPRSLDCSSIDLGCRVCWSGGAQRRQTKKEKKTERTFPKAQAAGNLLGPQNPEPNHLAAATERIRRPEKGFSAAGYAFRRTTTTVRTGYQHYGSAVNSIVGMERKYIKIGARSAATRQVFRQREAVGNLGIGLPIVHAFRCGQPSYP